MADEPEDQNSAPEEPKAGDSTPESKSGGPPAPDFPEPEVEESRPDTPPKPEPEPEERQDELTPAEDSESPDPGEAVAIGQGDLSESDDKTFGMLVHLLGGMTLLVGPMIIWMTKKEESPFVDDQGKESVNWQIGVLIVIVGLAVIFQTIPFTVCLAPVLYPIVGVGNLIVCILACVEASKGKLYRYPYSLRIIK